MYVQSEAALIHSFRQLHWINPHIRQLMEGINNANLKETEWRLLAYTLATKSSTLNDAEKLFFLQLFLKELNIQSPLIPPMDASDDVIIEWWNTLTHYYVSYRVNMNCYDHQYECGLEFNQPFQFREGLKREPINQSESESSPILTSIVGEIDVHDPLIALQNQHLILPSEEETENDSSYEEKRSSNQVENDVSLPNIDEKYKPYLKCIKARFKHYDKECKDAKQNINQAAVFNKNSDPAILLEQLKGERIFN